MENGHQPPQPRQAQIDDVTPPRIDWSVIIDDLRKHGCPVYRIAQHIGVGNSTARAWLKPKTDIGYGYGRALIRLHARYCGSALTFQRLTQADDCAYTSRA